MSETSRIHLENGYELLSNVFKSEYSLIITKMLIIVMKGIIKWSV